MIGKKKDRAVRCHESPRRGRLQVGADEEGEGHPGVAHGESVMEERRRPVDRGRRHRLED